MKLLAEATIKLLMAIAKEVDDFATKGRIGGITPWKYEPFNLLGLSPKKSYEGWMSLEDREFIKRNQKEIEITKKGRLAIIAHRARTKGIGAKWDKKWRVVIFDVPELSRKDRDFVRTHLKLLGLKECQKSVWISPWDVTGEIKDFFRLCDRKPEGSIRLMTVEKIDDDKDLMRLFGMW